MGRGLLVVDYQHDFADPGGALPVPGGEEIARRLNELAGSGDFDLVAATRDWHPADHASFVTAEPAGPWPVHCVAGTAGAELHPLLDRDLLDVIVDKGTDPVTEGYSAFEGTGLGALLRERGIDAVVVTGLATDYCVKNTALDAAREGLRVSVDTSAVRGVDLAPGDSERALEELRAAGVKVV